MIYDYIISGFGASGMSLLYRMMKNPFFNNKKILVVDKAPKSANDHTWCFWEKSESIFEQVVHHHWKKVHFYSDYYSGVLDLNPYEYKMIRSIELYNFVMKEATLHSNVSFFYGQVSSVCNQGEKSVLVADGKQFEAEYIFNSILFGKYDVPEGKHHLLQHFKGYVIETDKAVFDDKAATLMDFRVSQQHGTTFMYVLPVSPKRALVEYTLFTANLLQQQQYTAALSDYITKVLQIPESEYSIAEEEFGIIPMTNIAFESHNGRIINMGTAGGQTKPSSGYTFRFIQKKCDALINGLIHNNLNLEKTFSDKKFLWYDSVLLNVLSKNRLNGDLLFSKLFQNNTPGQVLKFLDNDTSLFEDVNIITSLPILPFLKAGFDEVF